MIDFERIIKSSRLYNFHSHTQFCDGYAPMEKFVEEAVKEGFTDYGFSPHSPIPFESPCNMSREAVAEYMSEFERLKTIYGNCLNLYSSMEIDYISKDWGPSNPYFDTIPLDYRIGSVHFIPAFDEEDKYIDVDGRFQTFKEKMQIFFHNDIEAVVRSFYKQSIDMVEAGGFDVIGHLDKIGHNAGHFKEGIEDEAWYEELFMQLFEAVMDNHLVIEVNTKAWKEHHRFFPNLKYFDLLKRSGATLLINSDAHYPALINAGRDDAMALLCGDI